MSLLKKTTSQTVEYAIFQAIALVISFISFPITTRIFTVEEYGQLALVNAVLAILIPFAKCGQPAAVIKSYAALNDEKDKAMIYTSSLSGILLCFFTTAIGYYFFTLVIGEYVSLQYPYFVLIMMIILLARTFNALVMSIFRAEEKVITLNMLGLAFRVGSIFVSITSCMLFISGLYGYLIGIVAFEGIITAIMLLFLFWKRYLNVTAISISVIKQLILYGFPLIFFEASSLVNDYADRFFIQYFQDSVQLGIYSVGYNISMYIQGFITSPLWMTIFPIYTKLWETEGPEKTRKYLEIALKYYICLAVLVLTGTILVSNEFIVIVAGAKYREAAQIVPYMTVCVLIFGTYHITGAGFFLFKKTKIIAAYTMACALLHAALNVYLIPKYQMHGAVYSAVLSYIILTIMITVKSRQLFKIKWPMKDVAVYFLSALFIGISLFWLKLNSLLATVLIKLIVLTIAYAGISMLYDSDLRSLILSLVQNIKKNVWN